MYKTKIKQRIMLYLIFTESRKGGRVTLLNQTALVLAQWMVNKHTTLCWSDQITISTVQSNLKSGFKDQRKQTQNTDKAEKKTMPMRWSLFRQYYKKLKNTWALLHFDGLVLKTPSQTKFRGRKLRASGNFKTSLGLSKVIT